MASYHPFAVKSGRNSGTGTGMPEILAKSAGVNTAARNQILLCAFFVHLIKRGADTKIGAPKFSVFESNMFFWTELGI
jgi:hypothetical protein